MPTKRELLLTIIALERESMALYARFAKIFAPQSEVRDFWFGMARDEARHVGALELVSTVLELEGKLDQPSSVSPQDPTIVRVRELVTRHRAEAGAGLPLERALGIALEIEETELEDLVADMLKAIRTDDYVKSLRLLVHDLSEMSYMIERYSSDPELLRRCDELVNRHAEALRLGARGR